MEWLHYGRKVAVTEAGRFQAEGLSFAFSTLEEARKAIEKDIKDTIGSLSLAVISGNGVKNTLTGIHGGHGGALLAHKNTWTGDVLYPDHPAVAKLLQEQKTLALAREQIHSQLEHLALMYFSVRDAALPDRNATAQADYDAKLAAAQALADRM